jgi:hypothetical protein
LAYLFDQNLANAPPMTIQFVWLRYGREVDGGHRNLADYFTNNGFLRAHEALQERDRSRADSLLKMTYVGDGDDGVGLRWTISMTSMAQQAALFGNPGLKVVAGGAAPRSSVTENLVEAFAAILEKIQPATVVEIGAHEASFSCDIKRRLPSATVIAVEANQHVYEHYGATRRIASSGIVYELCAIADMDGWVELNIPTLVAGTKKPLTNMMASLGQLAIPNSEHETVTVRAQRL